jgi:hypothetical protein
MVVEVVVHFVEENKANNCLYLVVDYLMDKDYYKMMMMEDQSDKVFEMTVHLDKVWIDWIVETWY